MDRVFGRDRTVYRANRWFVGVMILAAAGFGVALLHPAFHALLRASTFRRGYAFLNAVTPEIRVIAVQVIALAVIALAAVLVRFLFDPRMVSVDAHGIEVRQYFSTYRARWRDFVGMKAIGFSGMGTVQLRFRKAPGFSTRVNLPARTLGVDNKAVVVDVVDRLSDAREPPASLDKYDPKKLNALAVAAAAATAAADEPALLSRGPRRSFGRRTLG